MSCCYMSKGGLREEELSSRRTSKGPVLSGGTGKLDHKLFEVLSTTSAATQPLSTCVRLPRKCQNSGQRGY